MAQSKSVAAFTSKLPSTTTSCINIEIHSCAAERSSFDPPFSSSLPSEEQQKIDTIAPRLFYSSTEMPKAIKDEFSDLPVSRQRKSQLRMQRDRRCILCGEPTVGVGYCLKHWVERRERVRRKRGNKKRWKGARSYRLERDMELARRHPLKK
jgi:hypothetical protein